MKRLVCLVRLLTLALCGCTATKTTPRESAQDHLMEDGKLFYELGRFDEAVSRLEILLTQTSDERLRTNAAYYLDRIGKRLPPEAPDTGVPRCFGR